MERRYDRVSVVRLQRSWLAACWLGMIILCVFLALAVWENEKAAARIRTLEDALALTNQEVVDALGGLPAHKLHCSVLAEEAVKSAVQDYYERNNIPYDKSKFPKQEDCESCRMV